MLCKFMISIIKEKASSSHVKSIEKYLRNHIHGLWKIRSGKFHDRLQVRESNVQAEFPACHVASIWILWYCRFARERFCERMNTGYDCDGCSKQTETQ